MVTWEASAKAAVAESFESLDRSATVTPARVREELRESI
jgi:hypothetical protein